MRLNSKRLLAIAAAGLTVAAGVSVPAAGSAGSTASAAPGQEPIPAGRFRFVGASESGRHPFELLEPRDVELLMQLGEPLTPNEFLQRGMPLRTSQLATLTRRGFLVQEGDAFRSAFPVLSGDQAAVVAETLAGAAEAMIAGARSELARLRVILGADGAYAAFPAVCSWMLREAVWARLQNSGAIDVDNMVAQGRASEQTRGWWGVLWFSELGAQPYDFASARHEDDAVQLVWNRNAGELFVNRQSAAGSLARLLQDTRDVRDDGTRIRHPENFPGMQRYGIVNADGWLMIPTLQWVPEQQGSPAAAAQQAVEALAASIEANMPLRELVVQLRLPPTEVATLAYSELQPFLLEALVAEGFQIQLGTQLRPAVADAGDPSIRVQLPGDTPAPPPAAGVLWINYRGPRPQYELPVSDPR